MKIDVFTHIMPPKYKETLYNTAASRYLRNVIDRLPALYDLDQRFRLMDKYEGLKQVLTLSLPPLERLIKASEAFDVAKSINDELAEMVQKYPDRFAAAVACLPLNDVDNSLKEIDRALKDLKLRGIQLFSNINDKPLDSPDFLPIYEKMVECDLPIWLHPLRNADFPDYKTESKSKYMIFNNFGWPYETTVAMSRLVFSGIMDKYRELKIITHHCGGMVPFFEGRTISTYSKSSPVSNADYTDALSKPPIEYFKMFYADTALQGNTPALQCGHAFFGTERLLFGTDFPYPENSDKYTARTIEAVERMTMSDSAKQRIFTENASRLLHL